MIKSSKIKTIVSSATSRKIAYGVLIGHLLVMVVFPAVTIIWNWLTEKEKVETISVQLYDPTTDEIVDNASPDPDPSNPTPPSGNPDAGTEEQFDEQVEDTPEPDPQPQPDPTPVVNHTLPQIKPQVNPVKTIKQPKVKPRKKPQTRQKPQPRSKPQPNPRPRPNPSPNPSPSPHPTPGQRGSNAQPGHNRPGGQRGNTAAYQAELARKIRMMWVTPDKPRLGDRNPSVTIEITINRQGRVSNKRIIRKSGVWAMDESIQTLLNELNWVDPPDDGQSHTLQFTLTADQ